METPESPKERRALPEYFEKAWSQALLAVSTAEDEATRMLNKVAGAAGWGPEEVRRRVGEFTERLVLQRKDLERTVEDRVRKSLQGLKIPRRDEMAELSERLERISKRLDALAEKRRA